MEKKKKGREIGQKEIFKEKEEVKLSVPKCVFYVKYMLPHVGFGFVLYY